MTPVGSSISHVDALHRDPLPDIIFVIDVGECWVMLGKTLRLVSNDPLKLREHTHLVVKDRSAPRGEPSALKLGEETRLRERIV